MTKGEEHTIGDQMKILIDKATVEQGFEALKFYVDEDDVMEGMESNKYWVEGKRNAEKSIVAFQKALAQPEQEPLTDEAGDAARWRWLAWHTQVAWNDGKFTSLLRIVSDENRQMLNDSIDRMMAGDWSDADKHNAAIEAAHNIGVKP